MLGPSLQCRPKTSSFSDAPVSYVPPCGVRTPKKSCGPIPRIASLTTRAKPIADELLDSWYAPAPPPNGPRTRGSALRLFKSKPLACQALQEVTTEPPH